MRINSTHKEHTDISILTGLGVAFHETSYNRGIYLNAYLEDIWQKLVDIEATIEADTKGICNRAEQLSKEPWR